MLKPIEGLTMVRSFDVQKVQEVDHNRPNLEQHYFAREMTQQSQQRQTQVQTNDASETNSTVHRDLSKNNKRRNPNNNRSREQKKTDESEETVDDGRGHHIDFTV